MTAWLKSLAASLCILTILLHLIPQGKFAGYVRFYAGLLFFLIAAGPVLKLFTGEGELERLLQLEFVKGEYYDLETAAEGMAELKNEQIIAAYKKEILRQIKEIALAYKVKAYDVQLSFDGQDDYLLTGISFSVEEQENSSAVEAVRNELSGVFMLEMNDIRIAGRRG